jgi:hypothetical protein
MKTFATKILLFLLLLIPVSATLSWFNNTVVMRQSIVLRKDAQFREFCPDTRYLFLGDSRVMMGANPEYIEHAFNFGMSSENYVQTYYKLKYILEHPSCETKPACILLSFDQHSFSTQRLAEWAYDFYYFRYMSPLQAGRATGDYGEYLLRYLKVKVWSYQNQGSTMMDWIAGNLHLQKKEREMYRGYIPRHANFTELSDSAQTAQATRRARFNFGSTELLLYNPVILECFRKTLDLCAEHNIKVVLVTYPVTAIYSELAQTTYGADSVCEPLDAMLRERPEIYRINLLNEYANRLDLFDDSDHLNREGARLFSLRVAELLDQNGL